MYFKYSFKFSKLLNLKGNVFSWISRFHLSNKKIIKKPDDNHKNKLIPSKVIDSKKKQVEKINPSSELNETYQLYLKLMKDVEQKRIEENLERICMIQLMEYLEKLKDYKHNLKGYYNLERYFCKKIKELTDQDFHKFLSFFFTCPNKLQTPDIWIISIKTLLLKNPPKYLALQILLPISKLENQAEAQKNFIEYLIKYDDLKFEESFLMLSILSQLKYDESSKIWELIHFNLTKRVQYEKISEDIINSFLVILINNSSNLKTKQTLENFCEYFIINVSKFHPIVKIKTAILLGSCFLFDEHQFSLICIEILKNIDPISPDEVNKFILTIMEYCKRNQKFLKILESVESKQIRFLTDKEQKQFGKSWEKIIESFNNILI